MKLKENKKKMKLYIELVLKKEKKILGERRSKVIHRESVESPTEKDRAVNIDMVNREEVDAVKRGLLVGEMIHEDGRVETFRKENVIVDYSSLLMAQLMKGENVPGVTHIAVGTGYGESEGGNP